MFYLCLKPASLPFFIFEICDDLTLRWYSGVTFGLLGAAIIPMIMLVNSTPDQIPADVVAEQQNAAREKLEGA